MILFKTSNGERDLTRLPEKIRRTLEKLVQKLREQETVSGIGLFGSWSRGDADPSSDVDLLIIDERNFNYEYVDRLEPDGLLIDLIYIPKKWITGPVPPEIDQRLHELCILYDRDWSLANTKLWMSKAYQKPERVDVRTEAYVIESDIYLSRATSAHARGDFQSACIFAGLGVEIMLKTLIELNLLSISNSRFMSALKESAEKLEMPKFFNDYLSTARLSKLDYCGVEKKIGLFKSIWGGVATFMREHASTLNSLHFTVKTMLGYYGKRSFLKGMVARSCALLNEGMYIEASHYTLHTLVGMLENYAWLTSADEGIRHDHTTLLRSLRGLKETRGVYENAVEAFNVNDVDREEADKTIRLAKETILNVRRQRKDLINRLIDSSA
ncbi:MAG: nucleotidyltransferase domain-containing protein [Candidatus Bathyarchaeota archaeon]|nr:MAG: nucleotidyltransferase domain-containing protein [Candidatus Bathyarchaeota archaeon]